MFDLSDNNKKMFLYRRYCNIGFFLLKIANGKLKEKEDMLFLYDDYEYIETELDDTFLERIKNIHFLLRLILLPGEKSSSKWEIVRQLAAKRKALFSKEYLFCEDCFNARSWCGNT